ncbi:hypothetical protein FOL47_008339 [Perkinsus chesapeaki]|uniref:Uncharacterized protein n=1 Tax=Perkinsus chesapeaki TaxID=330153 RepID=A0A7J6MTV3_PERCH|nr:hypothetical protein FOL47_008339 [Perkinsus chesapeaki]
MVVGEQRASDTSMAKDRAAALQILLPEQFQRAETRSKLLRETCKYQRNPIDSSVVKQETCKAMLESMYKDDAAQFQAAVDRVVTKLTEHFDETLGGEVNLVFWFCAHYGRLECMKLMVEKLPVNLNFLHSCGHSVIARAAINDHVSVVDWLFTVGADHAAVTDPRFLEMAAHCGAHRTVELLRGFAVRPPTVDDTIIISMDDDDDDVAGLQ